MKKLIRKWLGIEELETNFNYHEKRANRYIDITKSHRGHISSYQSKVDRIEQKLKKH